MISKAKLIMIGGGIIVILGMVITIMYYKSELETTQHNLEISETINDSLNRNLNALKETNSISLEQMEELRKNEKTSVQYIQDKQREIDSLTFNITETQTKDTILTNINKYEECMSLNYSKPSVVCNFGFN